MKKNGCESDSIFGGQILILMGIFELGSHKEKYLGYLDLS